MTAAEFLEGQAMRAAAGHATVRLRQRVDLVLCPTIPAGPPVRRYIIAGPNLSRQSAISVPIGLRTNGLPNAVQIAAAQCRDDLGLRTDRVIGRAEPVPAAQLA
jgi:aspartyl-tRNA(Asn)/glutamyl-tRNA(Gln) amidotransferase subunit A